MKKFSDSTIRKISKKIPKILKDWAKDWKDVNYITPYKDAYALWDVYHGDIASDVFYALENEMYQYSDFSEVDEPGTDDYKLWEYFEEEIKGYFIQYVGDYLKFKQDKTPSTDMESILSIAKNMSHDDIKKTIVELINMI